MPPIGKYRFRHPKPVESWQGVFNATTNPHSCFQVPDTAFGSFRGSQMWNPNTPMSEDCLQLNVWVPRTRYRDLPVMVWIYGGAYYSGTISLDLYDGRTIAAEENVVVVSMNHRVGSLGFLFLDRSDAPGNAALFDQLMALEWIRDNIAAFNGDPKLVTLFGESSGAVSISFHLLSPLTRNLFTRAILQSGAMTAPWGILEHKEAIRRTLLLAESVGCPHTRQEADRVMECLLRTDPMDLMSNETGNGYGVIDFPFVPVVDGSFLDEMPLVSLQTKNFKKTQLLVGSDRDEATYFIVYRLPEFFKKEEEVFISPDDFKQIVRELDPYLPKRVQDAIIYEYTPWHDLTNAAEYRDAVDKVVGDYQFTCPVNEAAYRYAASGNEVYVYYFIHRSSYNPWPKWMGVVHGDEINFVFGEPLNDTLGYTRDEVELSRRMMRYWANFARTGSVQRNGTSITLIYVSLCAISLFTVHSDDPTFQGIDFPIICFPECIADNRFSCLLSPFPAPTAGIQPTPRLHPISGTRSSGHSTQRVTGST
jgi:acetylcholinesterase